MKTLAIITIFFLLSFGAYATPPMPTVDVNFINGIVNAVDGSNLSYADVNLTTWNGNPAGVVGKVAHGIDVPMIAHANNLSACLFHLPSDNLGGPYDYFVYKASSSFTVHLHHFTAFAPLFDMHVYNGGASYAWGNGVFTTTPWFTCGAAGNGMPKKLWVNGTLNATSPNNGWADGSCTTNNCIILGSDNGANPNEAGDGTFMLVMLWKDYYLTDDDVAYLFNNGSIIDMANPPVPVNVTNGTGYSIISVLDDFFNGTNCNGDTFSCGTTNDLIDSVGGNYNVTIGNDDGKMTMLCAIKIVGTTASVSSCLYRSGANSSSCDAVSEVANGNHSQYYACGANMTGCGWNANNGIPLFGIASPLYSFQLNTSAVGDYQYVFSEYSCNSTMVVASQLNNSVLHVAGNKGVLCNGNGYASVAYANNATMLGGTRSCVGTAFCDDGILRNYSMVDPISGYFCTPGCHDGIKDGNETDVDYGGKVCGNCTPNGKNSDPYHMVAVELQESKGVMLSASAPFNVSFCDAGEQVIASSTTGFLIVLLVSGVILVAIVAIILALGLPWVVGILRLGKYLKKK